MSTSTSTLTLGKVATMLSIAAVLVSAYVFDLNLRSQAHASMQTQMAAGDVELDLKRVELELKLLRTIAERRDLTADEEDRKAYLEELRAILIADQREKLG